MDIDLILAIGENPCKNCIMREPDKPCPERDVYIDRKKYEFRRKICCQIAYIRKDREYWMNYGYHRSVAISKERERRYGE